MVKEKCHAVHAAISVTVYQHNVPLQPGVYSAPSSNHLLWFILLTVALCKATDQLIKDHIIMFLERIFLLATAWQLPST